MKKTLTLMALLGALSSAPLSAEDIWWPGVEATPSEYGGYDLKGATATYKHNSSGTNPGDTPDYDMCWGVTAANQIAWWQEQVEQNGALIIPENAPRGNQVWEELRTMWKNHGYWVPMGIQHWLHGSENCGYISMTEKSNVLTEQGLAFGGYYPRVAQANFFRELYIDTANGYHNETALINVLRCSGNNPETSYAGISAQVKEMLEDGWSITFSTSSTASNHAMTVFGFEFDDSTGLIDKFYYSDNNNMTTSKDKAFDLPIYDGGLSKNGYPLIKAKDYGKIEYLYALRTTGIRFTDYDVRVGNNFEGEDEFLFSHYCNLLVDGSENHELKYDLRDASDEGSPVTPNIITYLDEFHTEEVTNKMATTGDLLLRGGKVTLVNCAEDRVKLDGGGKVAGVIRFQDSVVKGTTDTIQEADRTLKVDRTDTIAKEINLSATKGTNTLEVTENHTATFGTLSGTGDLDKTGKGTAEVTDAVTLNGEIRVKEGDFIFGKDVELTGNTVLTVSEGAHVQGAEGKAITLTIDSGVHVNDGVMTLTTTVNEGATLKGSGTFAMVTIDGGEMIVGNSPGHQNYEGALTLNSGRLVFCAAGLDTANDGDNTGWASGTYSTINMNGHDFVVNQDGKIVIALSADAANSLTSANGTVELTLATGLKSGAFSEEQLAALAEQTSFELSVEEGAGSGAKGLSTLNAPKFSYKMVNDALVLTTGVSGASPTVPEPATGTLGLLALAALAGRRRRK